MLGATMIVDGMSVMKNMSGSAAHLDKGFAFSFLTQINAAVKLLQPSKVICCWEGGFARRSELLPGYKADRKPTPTVIAEDRAAIKKLLTHLGVDQYYSPGHEADDAIAFLTNTLPGAVVIVSADKDFLQLVSPRVGVYQKSRMAPQKKQRGGSRVLITPGNFQEMTGWPDPATYLEAHCALGDAVDQIPKIEGVGEAVIHAYFMGMEIPPAKRRKLEDFYGGSAQYNLNKQLIDLTKTTQIPMECSPGVWSEADAYHMLTEMGFASIAGKFAEWIVPWDATHQ